MMIDKIVDISLSKKFDIEFLTANSLLPICEEKLFVAVGCSKKIAKEELQAVFGKPIKYEIYDDTQIQKSLANIKQKQDIYDTATKFLNHSKQNTDKHIENIITNILVLAVSKNSSDIHIQSQQHNCSIRYRVDGELVDLLRLNSKIITAISSVIKLKSGLNISNTRTPQDGSFAIVTHGLELDLRCSFVPNIYGESIVMRIHRQDNMDYNIDRLGFENIENIKNILNQKSGLVIVTGATGSGKTTSLYAMLNYLNRSNKKIITIEDPVEYKIDNIVQIQLNDDVGLGFENILRNILRQDPDIIMVGEIRDEVSLRLAITASLTGHLVLTTMHTNDAIDTIVRAVDLKAKPYMISSSLRLIISQKLSKKVCQECQTAGCVSCDFEGFKDRVMISESLFVDEKLKRYIEKNYQKTKLTKKLKGSYKTIAQKTKELIACGIIVV